MHVASPNDHSPTRKRGIFRPRSPIERGMCERASKRSLRLNRHRLSASQKMITLTKHRRNALVLNARRHVLLTKFGNLYFFTAFFKNFPARAH